MMGLEDAQVPFIWDSVGISDDARTNEAVLDGS